MESVKGIDMEGIKTGVENQIATIIQESAIPRILRELEHTDDDRLRFIRTAQEFLDGIKNPYVADVAKREIQRIVRRDCPGLAKVLYA